MGKGSKKDSSRAGELVSREERDDRLQEYLEVTVYALEDPETQFELDVSSKLVECLRYGARIALHPDAADDVPSSERPFLAPGKFRRKDPPPERVRILPPSVVQSLVLDEPSLLGIRPGHGWPARSCAWFHRLAGRCFSRQHSDDFLHATILAFRVAADFFFEEEVDLGVALDLRASEMRAMLYASQPHDAVRDVLEPTLDHYERAKLDGDDEYRFLVQINEVLERLRASAPFPRQLRLALRGLDIAAERIDAYQVAELHAAVGRCLAESDRESRAFDLDPVLRRHYDAAEPLLVAERALEKAIELERGAFYGRIEAFRKQSRIAKARLALARVLGAAGKPARALATCELARRDDPQTTAWAQKKQMVTFDETLEAAGVSIADRAAFAMRGFEADVKRIPSVDEWSVGALDEYLTIVKDVVMAAGDVSGARRLHDRVRVVPGYDRARAASEERLLAETAENEAFVERLTAAFLGSAPPVEEEPPVDVDVDVDDVG